MVLLVFTECEVKEMKDRNNPAVEYSVALKPASQEEAGLFYSDEKQDEVLGTVGHLRIDFGSGGKSFCPHGGLTIQTSLIPQSLRENSANRGYTAAEWTAPEPVCDEFLLLDARWRDLDE